MPSMTDPSVALASFQEEFGLRLLPLKPGVLDPELLVMTDQPSPGRWRMTYVRVDADVVTAMAMFVADGFIDGRPCFALGYAVPEGRRGEGRAKEIVRAGLAEMKNGLRYADALPFFVEAIIGAENLASQAVASSTIATDYEEMIDEISGIPARRYIIKVG